MARQIIIDNYEFTLSAKGALLSFDLPEEIASARPKGFSGAPSVEWSKAEAQLSLTYPNLPRPALLIFKKPPPPLASILERSEPFVACQNRAGRMVSAHICSALAPAPAKRPI